MKKGLVRDQCGGTAIEFALAAPLFLTLIAGVAGFGLLMWSQIGLQHAVEMAARCASVNPGLCGTSSQIQAYAVTQAGALNPPASIFEISAPSCGLQVTARYEVTAVSAILGFAPMTVTAQYCFPK